MKKLDTLEPDFKVIAEAIINEVESATGRVWGVAQARRTMAEQNALYAQGRTKKGEIVTNAKAGLSAHNYGLAVDICPMLKDGSDFDWNAPKSLFQTLQQIVLKHGMVSGYSFKLAGGNNDPDHFEHPRWHDERALWQAGKVKIA